MRWAEEDSRWVCSTHLPITHFQFQPDLKTKCWCPLCDVEREKGGEEYPYANTYQVLAHAKCAVCSNAWVINTREIRARREDEAVAKFKAQYKL